MSIIHPAVQYVFRSVRLWDEDKQRADMRAHLIVCRLIDAGFLVGEVKGMMAYRKEPDDGCGDGPVAQLLRKQSEHAICPGCGKPILGAQTKTHMGQEWHLLCLIPSNAMDERRVPRFDDLECSGLKKSSA